MKFKKKNKVSMAIMTGALVTILATGAINAQLLSGYESFKKAVRESIYVNNATYDISMKLSAGNKMFGDERTTLRIDKKNNKSHNTNYYYDKETGKTRTSETYVDGNKRISTHENHLGETEYYVYINNDQNVSTSTRNMLDIPDEFVDILELSADAFIGMSKDYFVTNEEGTNKVITGNFDKTQIPAIGNAFTSFAFSQINEGRYYVNSTYTPDADSLEGYFYYNNIKSGYINSLSMTSSIDSAGLFEQVDMQVQLMCKSETGAEYPLDLSFTAKISNKNTTAIVLPNVNKDDKNVTWNEYNTDTSINYYELNQDVIEKYHDVMGKVSNKMYGEVMTDEEKQTLIEALNAFDALLNYGDVIDTYVYTVEMKTSEDTVIQVEVDSDKDAIENEQSENDTEPVQNIEEDAEEIVNENTEEPIDETVDENTEEPIDGTVEEPSEAAETSDEEESEEE